MDRCIGVSVDASIESKNLSPTMLNSNPDTELDKIISVFCPSCQVKLRLPSIDSDKLSKMVRCPRCKSRFQLSIMNTAPNETDTFTFEIEKHHSTKQAVGTPAVQKRQPDVDWKAALRDTFLFILILSVVGGVSNKIFDLDPYAFESIIINSILILVNFTIIATYVKRKRLIHSFVVMIFTYSSHLFMWIVIDFGTIDILGGEFMFLKVVIVVFMFLVYSSMMLAGVGLSFIFTRQKK